MAQNGPMIAKPKPLGKHHLAVELTGNLTGNNNTGNFIHLPPPCAPCGGLAGNWTGNSTGILISFPSIPSPSKGRVLHNSEIKSKGEILRFAQNGSSLILCVTLSLSKCDLHFSVPQKALMQSSLAKGGIILERIAVCSRTAIRVLESF